MRRKSFLAGILIIFEVMVCLLIIAVICGATAYLRAENVQLRFLHVDRVSAEEDQEWSFEIDAPGKLILDSSAGQVTIVAGDGNQVVVRGHKTSWHSSKARAEAELKKMTIVTGQQGNTVTVRFKQQPKAVFAGAIRSDTVDFTITVPKQMAIEAVTRNGTMSLSGTETSALLHSEFGAITVSDVSGALDLSTNSGAITARDIQSRETDIKLDTAFGKVTVEDVACRLLTVKSNSGKLRLENVTVDGQALLHTEFGEINYIQGSAGTLEAKTQSGKVLLEDLAVDGAVTVGSGFGGVVLDAVDAASYDVQSESGDIVINGAQGKIRAHSGFGSVSVSRAQDASLDLSTNSGKVEFSGSLGEGPHTLTTEYGDIRLILPHSTALDVDLQTEFGKLRSDIPVALSGETDSSHWQGTLNGGGAELTAKTNSGAISIEIMD